MVRLLAQINLEGNEIGGYENEDHHLVFTPEGPQAIAKALRVSTSLTRIDLTYNWIEDEGAEHLAKGISDSASLTDIDLSYNNISPLGGIHIANAMSISTSMTYADLRYNQLGADAEDELRRIV